MIARPSDLVTGIFYGVIIAAALWIVLISLLVYL